MVRCTASCCCELPSGSPPGPPVSACSPWQRSTALESSKPSIRPADWAGKDSGQNRAVSTRMSLPQPSDKGTSPALDQLSDSYQVLPEHIDRCLAAGRDPRRPDQQVFHRHEKGELEVRESNHRQPRDE